MTEDNVFELITDYTVGERMIGILLRDRQYQEVQGRIAGQVELLAGLNLGKEQRLAVERLVSLHAESGALYGRAAYQQGYRDCVALLQAVNLIKAL